MPRTHKTLRRLFIDTPMQVGTDIALDKPQAHYLANVMRHQSGDRCVTFNGRDGAFLARIDIEGKKQVALHLLERSMAQTPPSTLWYGFAPIKRLDYIVQKATEMGAGSIQPILTEYVQNPRIKTDKLHANVIEAAEQCEVISVPEIKPAMRLDTLLDTWQETHGDRVLIFCDEDSASASPVESLRPLCGKPLGLLIGPEGGFSPAEREKLRSQEFVTAISLGPRILRADTAAVAAMALIQAVAGDW